MYYRLIGTVALLVALGGCSTHFSTLRPEQATSKIIYEIPEEQAFGLAHRSLTTVLPGRKISDVSGPVRGYSTWFRFVLDTYTQQVLVFPASGVSRSGGRVDGYYFEVSGSGSAIVQGRAKNVQVFETLSESLAATGKGVEVANVRERPYEGYAWSVEEPKNVPAGTADKASTVDEVAKALEKLKELRDSGAITEREYEAKKKELLGRI